MSDLIDIGISPNDGQGDSIRESFIKVNNNFSAITTFLNDPTFSTATIKTAIFNDVQINEDLHIPASNTKPGTTNINCSLTVGGGTAINGNVFVGDTVYGNVDSNRITSNIANFDTLWVTNNSSVLGNLTVNSNAYINGSLTVFGDLTTIKTTKIEIQDPQMEMGKLFLNANGTPVSGTLTENDGIDRGILAYWYSDAKQSQQTTFFGIDTQTGNLTIRNQDTALGDISANTIYANVSATGNSTISSLYADTISASNGITGTLATADQPNITSVGTLTTLKVGPNVEVKSGTVYIDNSPVVTSATSFNGGTVGLPTRFTDTTANAVSIVGGLTVGSNLSVTNTTTVKDLNVTGSLTGILSTTSQPNITSVGVLDVLTVSNNTATGSLSVSGESNLSTIRTQQIIVDPNGGGITGRVITADQPDITTVGTLTNLNVAGKITGNINGTVGATTPSTGAFTTITSASGITGTLQTNAQPNITSVGSLSSLSVTGQSTLANVSIQGGLQVTGAITSASGITGTLQTNAQPNITSVGSLSSLSVDGYSTFNQRIQPKTPSTIDIGSSSNQFRSIYTSDTIYATTMNAGGQISGNIIHATTDFWGPIGSTVPDVGKFTNLTVTGTLTAAGFSTSGSSFNNPAITGGTIDGAVIGLTTPVDGYFRSLSASVGITGPLITPVQNNITQVGTLTGLTVTGTINGTATNVVTNANMTGDVTSIGNSTTIAANKVTNAKMAKMAATRIKGNANAYSDDPQDLTIDQLNGLLPTFGTTKGLVPGVAFNTTQYLRADGTFAVPSYPAAYTHPTYSAVTLSTTGNTIVSGITTDTIGSVLSASTRSLSLSDLGYTGATNANYITNTNQLVNGSGFITSSSSITGSASTAGTVTTAAQPAITSVGTLTSLSVTGNVSTGDLTVGGNLTVNGTMTTINSTTVSVADLNITVAKNATNQTQADGAGLTVSGANANITYVASTDRWQMNKDLTVTNVYGNAVTACYADLAERYESDAQYDVGTVLIFGGTHEVTVTGSFADPSVAGAVSENPAYLMNANAPRSVAVALRGKVKIKVMGPVRKGDLLVTSYVSGYAESVGKDTKFGVSVFAKAVEENIASGAKIIYAVII